MKRTFIVCLIGCLSLLLASCGETLDPSKYLSAISSAYQTVTTVSQETTVYDGETLLSSETITIEKDDVRGITKVVTTSRRLAPIDSDEMYVTNEVILYFTLTAKYSNESGTWVKEDGVFASQGQGFDWNIDYLEVVSYDQQIKDGSTLRANVLTEHIQDLLKEEINASNMQVEVVLDSKQAIDSLSLNYISENGNDIQISTSFSDVECNLVLPI